VSPAHGGSFDDLELGLLNAEDLDCLLQDVLSQSGDSSIATRPSQMPGEPAGGHSSTAIRRPVATDIPSLPVPNRNALDEDMLIRQTGLPTRATEEPGRIERGALAGDEIDFLHALDEELFGDTALATDQIDSIPAAVQNQVTRRPPESATRNAPIAEEGRQEGSGPGSSRAVDRIAEQILERFPGVAPATLMFVGTDQEVDVDGVAARVAAVLANCGKGNVLLVDGNVDSRQLTAMMGVDGSSGLAEVVNQNALPDAMALATDNGNLSFMPAGKGSLTNRKLDSARASALNRQFCEKWQFTIITGGWCGEPLVQSWARYVDAVYLIIDLEKADRPQTIRLVDHLREQSVRVAGCVAVQP
jgi:Mrp family chromosome partitioning ATPase